MRSHSFRCRIIIRSRSLRRLVRCQHFDAFLEAICGDDDLHVSIYIWTFCLEHGYVCCVGGDGTFYLIMCVSVIYLHFAPFCEYGYQLMLYTLVVLFLVILFFFFL